MIKCGYCNKKLSILYDDDKKPVFYYCKDCKALGGFIEG